MENSKDITNYLHLYIGCNVMTPDGAVLMTGFGQGDIFYEPLDGGIGERCSDVYGWDYTDIKLLLRPLSSITEEEFSEMLIIANENNFKILERDEIVLRQTAPEIMRYLLAKSFDLFSLIDAGLAIDSTKLKD